jgi:asparagine synthase (glutamine-hydrolysing)
MVAGDPPVTIVYNGEVYNFGELRRQLRDRGYIFKGGSDTEVILNLYLERGHEMLTSLNGIFSLAIWDSRSRKLLLARDPMGVKPLYYCRSARGFAFASEIKALFASGAIKPEVNSRGVMSHLLHLWSAGPDTIASGVQRLAPGHAMLLDANSVTEREWCYADPVRPRPAESDSIEGWSHRLVSTLKDAVARQVISDVPLGAFLSGGLDSSSVVAFARQHTAAHRLQCFTIASAGADGQNDGFADDLPYAKRVAQHLDVDLNIVSVGPEMADRLPEMIYHLDEPAADPAALNTLFISELARANGIKVLLSGSGGDDIFTGYRRHYAVQQERWWRGWPRPARAALRAMTSAMPVNIAATRRLRKAFEYADLDNSERLISYFNWTTPTEAARLLSADMRQRVAKELGFQSGLAATLSRVSADASPLEKMLYLECKHFLADHNLNYADKMGMAVGIEIRVPLLDLELVRLATGIPISLRQKGREGKWIFKHAMEPYLPHDVIYRPKTGFGAPLRSWFKGRLRPLIDDVFEPTSLARRGLFEPEAVRSLLARDRAGSIDATYTIFSMLCVELWCRRYVGIA